MTVTNSPAGEHAGINPTRHTVDSLNSDALDELYDDRDRLRAKVAEFDRLRTQLAAERDKARRAEQHPRPDLDHLHVTAPNGIAAGLEIALALVDHHLRKTAVAPTAPDLEQLAVVVMRIQQLADTYTDTIPAHLIQAALNPQEQQ